MQVAKNTFQNGLIQDFSPEVTGNTSLSYMLNGTLFTFNGNEYSLQNDMGNVQIKDAYLPPGYIPIGSVEYGGIIYVVAYNPITNKSQIGSFPCPERLIGEDMTETVKTDPTDNIKFPNKVFNEKLNIVTLNKGDLFTIEKPKYDEKNFDILNLKYVGHDYYIENKYHDLIKINPNYDINQVYDNIYSGDIILQTYFKNISSFYINSAHSSIKEENELVTVTFEVSYNYTSIFDNVDDWGVYYEYYTYGKSDLGIYFVKKVDGITTKRKLDANVVGDQNYYKIENLKLTPALYVDNKAIDLLGVKKINNELIEIKEIEETIGDNTTYKYYILNKAMSKIVDLKDYLISDLSEKMQVTTYEYNQDVINLSLFTNLKLNNGESKETFTVTISIKKYNSADNTINLSTMLEVQDIGSIIILKNQMNLGVEDEGLYILTIGIKSDNDTSKYKEQSISYWYYHCSKEKFKLLFGDITIANADSKLICEYIDYDGEVNIKNSSIELSDTNIGDILKDGITATIELNYDVKYGNTTPLIEAEKSEKVSKTSTITLKINDGVKKSELDGNLYKYLMLDDRTMFDSTNSNPNHYTLPIYNRDAEYYLNNFDLLGILLSIYNGHEGNFANISTIIKHESNIGVSSWSDTNIININQKNMYYCTKSVPDNPLDPMKSMILEYFKKNDYRLFNVFPMIKIYCSVNNEGDLNELKFDILESKLYFNILIPKDSNDFDIVSLGDTVDIASLITANDANTSDWLDIKEKLIIRIFNVSIDNITNLLIEPSMINTHFKLYYRHGDNGFDYILDESTKLLKQWFNKYLIYNGFEKYTYLYYDINNMSSNITINNNNCNKVEYDDNGIAVLQTVLLNSEIQLNGTVIDNGGISNNSNVTLELSNLSPSKYLIKVIYHKYTNTIYIQKLGEYDSDDNPWLIIPKVELKGKIGTTKYKIGDFGDSKIEECKIAELNNNIILKPENLKLYFGNSSKIIESYDNIKGIKKIRLFNNSIQAENIKWNTTL